MQIDRVKLGLTAAAVFAIVGCDRGTVEISSEEILGHIKQLASEDLEGRRAGTRGGRKAARYVAKEFRSYDLEPAGKAGFSFGQTFEFVSGVKLGRRNKFQIRTGEEEIDLEPGEDFRPLGFSGSGELEGEVVFVGYGIESEELGYDDYEDVDAEGKVAMILRYSPDGTNPHGEFGKYAPLRYKVMTAREQGASAAIVVVGPEDDDVEGYLMGLRYDRSAGDVGIPALTITQRWAKEILGREGKSLTQIQKEINESTAPQSFDLGISVALETSLKKVESRTSNVIGVVEGDDPGFSDEYVVVGAHYDHLGWGGEGSLAPDTVAIHNGADDNASGTAGLLELAQWFGQNRQKRSIIFAAFGAEELGLLGSGEFVERPPVLLQKIHAMVNMDMVGRMKDSTLVVGGAGTSSIWKELVGELASRFDINPKFDDPGYGASDHQSFYLKDIPVLFFFTGVHDDYSRPSDDWEKINSEGEKRIIELAREVILDLANRKDRPDFVEVEDDEPARGGFPVYLGTVPDYSATEVEGMRLAGVREGGPAQTGGLREGDIIIGFGDKKIRDIYDFMYALQEAKAGETVTIVVTRDEEEVALQVVPARRRD